MKTTWIVGGLLVLVLLLLTLRERFTSYEDALRDVGQTSGQISPTCPDGMTLKPGGETCEKKNPSGSVETTTPQCAPGYAYTKRGTNWTCVSQTPVTTPPGTPPASSSTTPSGTPSGTPSTTPGQFEEGPMPTCPPDTMLNLQQTECRGQFGPVADPPTCPSGFVFTKVGPLGTCKASTTAPVPGSAGEGTVSGTTTGGTSGMSFGPTSQSKMIGQKVWGPASKGLGEDGRGPKAGDSTKSTPYPVLLGGETGKSSTRIEGVGVVPPSFSGLSDVLPSSKVLGTEDSARFLPFSREPGDQDLIPDPYRLAKNFSTSSYTASKTDPVPFLTDFSAFYK